jgi:hypothetical protein
MAFMAQHNSSLCTVDWITLSEKKGNLMLFKEVDSSTI